MYLASSLGLGRLLGSKSGSVALRLIFATFANLKCYILKRMLRKLQIWISSYLWTVNLEVLGELFWGVFWGRLGEASGVQKLSLSSQAHLGFFSLLKWLYFKEKAQTAQIQDLWVSVEFRILGSSISSSGKVSFGGWQWN